MDEPRCCVCHRPFPPPDVRWLGGRPFCTRHHDLALHATAVRWSRAGLVEAALLAGFVGTVALVFGNAPLPTDLGVGLLLALVPAALFLVFVYRQDRVEPEPAQLVLVVFALGGLLGWAAVDPLGDWLLGGDRWQHRSGLAGWVAAVGVRGTLSVFFAYLAVRYTVYLTPEFDEPVDGIVYATAAMLGMAAASGLSLVTAHDTVLPLAGATAIASTTLVDVATGVILGYGLGRARFDPVAGQRWLTASFFTAALTHGFLEETVRAAGVARGTFDPMLAFGVALALAAVVLASSHFITARFARQSLEEGGIVFD